MRPIRLALMIAGCNGDKDGPTSVGPEAVDFDEDGFTEDVDCHDGDPAVFPGADDAPYDGVDADCAGDDDYDADGDGFASEDYGGDDCFDGSADISPAAAETPYDAVDNDCDPATADDDVDGDGFLFLADCDDQDAARYPGALEALDDGKDSDCDGLEDAGPFAFGDFLWQSPTRPRVALTDHGFVVAVAATSLASATYLPKANAHVAVALTLAEDGGGAQPLAVPPTLWHGEYDDDPMADVDIVSTGPGAFVGTAYVSAGNQFGYLKIQPLTWITGAGWLAQAVPSYVDEPIVDVALVDVALDDAGVPWICGSDADALGYARGGVAGPTDGTIVAAADGAVGCFFEPGSDDPMPFTTCSDTDCATWRTDPDGDPTPVAAPSQPYAGQAWDAVRERDGVLSVVLDGGGARMVDAGVETDLLPGQDVRDADALRASDGTVFVAAVVNDGKGNRLVLAHGSPPGAMTVIDLPVVSSGRTFYPTGAALGLTDDRVLVVAAADEVLGGDDGVGWLFLGR